MKIWNALFNVFALLLIIIMLPIFGNILTTNDRQFEQIRLGYAVDYAIDAAMSAGIRAGANRVDVAQGLEVIEINMNNILPVFDSMMALSYDMALDDYTKATIEQSIATGVLCTIDGYYVLESYESDDTPFDAVSGGDTKLMWGLKRPYICYNNGRLFSLNLINENTTEFLRVEEDSGFGTTVRLKYRTKFKDIVDKVNGTTVTQVLDDTGLTDAIRKQTISQLITEDMNIAINARNKERTNKNMSYFYMPSSESLSAINNIKSPTLLIIFQDSTMLTGYDIDSVSIAGARVRPKRNVIGFKLMNGSTEIGKFYCYEGQQLVGADLIKPYTVSIEEVFNTIDEAAQAGYRPHFGLLTQILDE